VAAIDGKRIELSGETFAQAQTATSPDIGPSRVEAENFWCITGWGDSDVAPLATTDYYERATRFFSGKGEDIKNSVRLFMVPGMGHCRGGANATDTFDALTALEDWVEKDRPPERIIASHLAQGVVKKTRPLCPYPQVARWTGKGSTDDVANFICTKEK
jgi:feruloyl esterase